MKSSISRWTKVISVGAFSLIPQTRPMRLFGAVLLAALVSTSAAAKPGGPGHGDCRSCGDTPLWGYADLHTHPASNFAFGANEKGENGVIHGKPGLAYTSDPVLEDFNLISDLPSCDADQHGDIWWDLVKDGTRSAGFSALDGSPGGNHLPSGFVNDFYGWPDARSVTHQQMHVQWLHRAWEGGLRLMVASTVDNQVLAALWGKDWFQLFHADELGNAGEKDYESARRQLKAIEDMAAANSKWMAIARSGTEARQIIAAGKLALVLGLEQDSLSIDDILSLRDEFGVTVVHPIHLVDNDLGGTAVYDDLFNTATKSLEGNYVEVEFDPSVRYRYGAPHYLDEQLAPIVLSPDPLQDLIVTPVDENDWQCQNGWESCVWPDPLLTTAGHRNALGLTDTGRKGIAKLLDKGMIMDLAHMGDKAREDVLDIADTCLRPVIDSHTALRLDLEDATHALDPERREASERDLLEADAVRIANGGGIVGLGTAGPFQPVTLFRAEGEPLERMGNPATNPDLVDTQTWQFDEAHLRIALHTGKDGMRGQEDFDPDAEVHATVTHADNSTDEWTLQEYRDGDLKLIDTFEDWGYDWVTVPLRAGTRANEVVNLKLTLVQDTDDWKADNWDLQGIEVYYVGREEARRLYHEHAVGDDVVHRFSKNDEADKPKDGPSWEAPLTPDLDHQVAVLDLWTGGDDLRCDSYATLRIEFTNQTLWSDTFEQRVSPRDGLRNNSYFERPLILPQGRTLQDVANVSLTHHQDDPLQSCQIVDTETEDNWNLDRIRLSTPQVGRIVAMDRHAGPFFRFTNNSPEVVVAGEVTWDRPFRNVVFNTDGPTKPIEARYLRVAVRTGDDDIVFGSIAKGTIFDTSLQIVAEFDLNQGTKWSDRTDHWTVVDLGTPRKLTDLKSITISFDPTIGPNSGYEEWKIRGIEVQALGSPMATWWEEYQHASALLGERSVSIGTDLNGLQSQISYSEVAHMYPLPFPTPPAGVVAPPTISAAQTAGGRTFDFASEGISNIGQLPEFVSAVGLASGSSENVAPLFRSAGDFVQMWEKIDALVKAPTIKCTR